MSSRKRQAAPSPSPPPPAASDAPAKGRPRKALGSERQFPGKLHSLLDHAIHHNLERVIEWVLDGKAFIVHDPDSLMEILPLFFGQTKYRSFQRQLNMWSFERLLDGPHKGAFTHPYFVRGEKSLCRQISRSSFQHPDPDKVEGYRQAAAMAAASASVDSGDESLEPRGSRKAGTPKRMSKQRNDEFAEDSKFPAVDNAFDLLLDRAIRSAPPEGSVGSSDDMDASIGTASVLNSPIQLESSQRYQGELDIEPAAFAFDDHNQTVAQSAVQHPSSSGQNLSAEGQKFFFLDMKQRPSFSNTPVTRQTEDRSNFMLPMAAHSEMSLTQNRPSSSTSLPDRDMFGSSSDMLFTPSSMSDPLSPRPLPPQRSMSASIIASRMATSDAATNMPVRVLPSENFSFFHGQSHESQQSQVLPEQQVSNSLYAASPERRVQQFSFLQQHQQRNMLRAGVLAQPSTQFQQQYAPFVQTQLQSNSNQNRTQQNQYAQNPQQQGNLQSIQNEMQHRNELLYQLSNLGSDNRNKGKEDKDEDP